MKAIHVERIGTTYRVSVTTGEEGVAETEVCAGRESLIVALGKGGTSQKGMAETALLTWFVASEATARH
jgi:hypothetical protein